MQIFYKVKEIQDYLTKFNSESVGFVATMGSLHKGHLSLINASQQENKITICSIFINPKQFSNQEDLIKYPQNIDLDIEKLKSVNCDIVFIPNVEEVYPNKVEKEFYFGVLSEVMEAKHRPGHFNGVAIVIERFFEILSPTRAYFGEKDFQQLAVIRALVKKINSSVKIIGCPIYREINGLAMSSRNERLSEAEKEEASEISKALTYVCQHKNSHSVTELKDYFMNRMSMNKLFVPEYFEIADKNTLVPINNWSEAKTYIAFTAVNVEGVRLIDNMTIIN
ncbi:MAG: pantoate--beta-alanine ligase [Flavobacteriales bacterium]|nr:MAG: pantoate--beta-alanine ligase [Flavobacteriales bacterium]